MGRAPRIVAAALGGSAAAALIVAALASGAGSRASARVELQVAPRGLGSVSSQPPGRDADNQVVTEPCAQNDGEDDCRWFYESGQTVTLTARRHTNFTSSFSAWSTPDCPGTGTCTLTLDADETSVVAVFNPLRLGVKLSNGAAAEVTTDPAGKPCQRKLEGKCFEFPANTPVRVTVTASGTHKFRGWNPGCEPRNERTCTIRVLDEPTWVGATFDDDDPPQLPTTISVRFRLRKGGNGNGRVTAPNLDCGSACSAKFGYGGSLSVTAQADPASVFDGWNGVCARTLRTCTFPVGPITSIRALFARDTVVPSMPGGLAVESKTQTSIALSWAASTDNAGVTGYRVYLDDATAGDTTATEFTVERLTCGRRYGLAVDAVDAAGNRSPKTALDVETQQCPFAARVAGVGLARAGKARSVVVRVRVSRQTTARLKLTSKGRRVAGGRFSLRAGTNALRLGVPRQLPAGRYRLTITIANPDGGAQVVLRNVFLPRPR